MEGTSQSPLYLPNSADLKSDDRNILDFTARMFIQMNAGEVLGFVATSLVAIGAFFILVSYCYRCLRRPNWRLSQFWDKEWRVDTPWQGAHETTGSSDKDKMVASVLHHMRIEPTMPDSTDFLNDCTGELGEDVEERRTFYRSELPPLPGVGRVISVIGSTFVNDSIVLDDLDETMTIDGTAHDSRTSGIHDLNSEYGIVDRNGRNIQEIEMIPRSQTRRRVNRPLR